MSRKRLRSSRPALEIFTLVVGIVGMMLSMLLLLASRLLKRISASLLLTFLAVNNLIHL